MAAWKVFWADEEFWLARRADGDPQEAARRLGTNVQAVLHDRASAAADGVGALTLGELRLPDILEGPMSQVMLWSRGDLVLMPTSEVSVSELAGSGAWSTERLALLCSIDADRVAEVDALQLGEAIYRLIGNPQLHDVEAAGVPVRRGPHLSLDDERWVVWLRSELRDPATLAPPEIVNFGWRPPAGPVAASDENLSLAGFLLKGDKFDEIFVSAGPGGMSVLFGRNGAGKSLALEAMEGALRALRNGAAAARALDTIAPTCTVLLDAGRQDDAPRLFALLLAHLGWSPLSDLPVSVRRGCDETIAAWSSHEARPPGAPGLTASQLAGRPLEELRRTVADRLAAWLAAGSSDHTRVLAEALVSSATVAVTPDWQVGLAIMPGRAADELVSAARQHLNDAEKLGPQDADPSPLHLPLYRLARQLTGLEPGEPIVVLTVNLARRGLLSRFVQPDSGWLDLGDDLATTIARSMPRPLVLAPGRDADKPADAAVEMSVLGLLEELLGLPDDPQPQDEHRHPFAEHQLHAIALAAILQKVANSVLPRFVADAGTLRLDIAPQGEWHRRRARAVFTGGLAGDVPVDALPSGLRTWALAATSFAQALLLDADWTGADPSGDDPWRSHGRIAERDGWRSSRNIAIRVCDPQSLMPLLRPVPNLLYLLDEPEAHLHLTAQRDVVDLADSLAQASCGVIAATHSMAFLDAPAGRSQLVTLHASAGKIQSSTWIGLRDLAENASTLGITTSALAITCRGVLVVEGRNDRVVIERYGGIDLDKERIIIVVLQGHHAGAGIAELEFLHALRIPVFVLLDHVRREALDGALAGKGWGYLTGEEQTLMKLHHALKECRLQARALAFPHLDIIRAVPEGEITWALQRLGRDAFMGWKQFDAHAAQLWKHGTKFKETFRASTGVSVEAVISCLVRGDRKGTSPDLHGVLAQMLDDIGGALTVSKLGVQPPGK